MSMRAMLPLLRVREVRPLVAEGLAVEVSIIVCIEVEAPSSEIGSWLLLLLELTVEHTCIGGPTAPTTSLVDVKSQQIAKLREIQLVEPGFQPCQGPSSCEKYRRVLLFGLRR